MDGDEFLAREIVRYGAYVCMRRSNGRDGRAVAAGAAVPALAERLQLQNEFSPGAAPPRDSIAFLRRHAATPGGIVDDDVLEADWIIHVASKSPEPVAEFCAETSRLLGDAVRLRILSGVVRPPNYTGAAMQNFAYARAIVQQPGTVMPNAFLVPLSKTAAWWAKDWMERHTYFLPRYDDAGRMHNEGHTLAAAPGIGCLLRRTYKSTAEPAADGDFDFISYFECTDADVPVFHAVCDALRDVARNPEWAFVREGPTWHGRRTATWPDLFT